MENSQVAVYLVYAGRRGHTAVDRELYLRARGPTGLTAARRPGSPRTPRSRPNPNWRLA
ncbi:hypothetical protein ACWGH1_04900 [Streptomyces sp. NPDC054883]